MRPDNFVIGLVRGSGDSRTSHGRRARTSLQSYASARGWNDIDFAEESTGTALLHAGELGPLFRTVSAGSTVIVKDLAALADKPSELLAGVPKVLGLHQLHVAELNGPISAVWEPLSAALKIGVAAEKQAADERKARLEEREEMMRALDDYKRTFSAAVVSKYRLPLVEVPVPLALTPAALPEQTEDEPEDKDFTQLGSYLRLTREALGKTQSDLSAELGISESSISRTEQTGSGPTALRMAELLDPTLMPEQGMERFIDAQDHALMIAKARMRAL